LAPAGPYRLHERGPAGEHSADILVSKVPWRVAESERELLADDLGWPREHLRAREITTTPGPGNVVTVLLRFAGVTEVVTGFGEKGLPAQRLVRKLTREIRRYLASSAPVGPHLADQLLVPLALTAGGAFTATETTEHTRTNAETVRAFLGDVCRIEEADGGTRIEVRGATGKS
jgi:RNA 3'-terminal phosphate cyclase (ATP)